MDELQINVMSGGPRVRSVRTQSRGDTFLQIKMDTFWTLFLIAPFSRVCPHHHNPLPYNNLYWWAHLDSNQGPTDYEGKSSGRHFKVFLEMAPNLLSRVSTSVQRFHGVA